MAGSIRAISDSNHGNLGDTDVDEGDNIAIPAIIGEYHTHLRRIPLTTPALGVSDVGGYIGCIVVLMEEDNTPNSAISLGHEALDRKVRDGLAGVIAGLTLANPSPTQGDIDNLTQEIGAAAKAAIGGGVSVIDWLGGFGNMDDQIGSATFLYSTTLWRPLAGFQYLSYDGGEARATGRSLATLKQHTTH